MRSPFIDSPISEPKNFLEANISRDEIMCNSPFIDPTKLNGESAEIKSETIDALLFSPSATGYINYALKEFETPRGITGSHDDEEYHHNYKNEGISESDEISQQEFEKDINNAEGFGDEIVNFENESQSELYHKLALQCGEYEAAKLKRQLASGNDTKPPASEVSTCPAPGYTVGITPTLFENKDTTIVPGHTIYVKIDLGTGNYPLNKTGIYVPSSFNPREPFDILLYMHGNNSPHPGSNAQIDVYWNYSRKDPHYDYRLREEINSIGKNIILVAPSLGDKPSASSYKNKLNTDGGLDYYMVNIISAIQIHIFLKFFNGEGINFRNLILAAHSGGGPIMSKIAVGNNPLYGCRISECWGFDSLIHTNKDLQEAEVNTWTHWAKANSEKKLIIYHMTYWKSSFMLCSSSKELQNVRVLKSTAPTHRLVPITHLQDRVKNIGLTNPAETDFETTSQKYYEGEPAMAGSETVNPVTVSAIVTNPVLRSKSIEKVVLATIGHYDSLIESISSSYSFDPNLVRATIAAESGGKSNAGENGSGYKGLMQAEVTKDQLNPAVSLKSGIKKYKLFRDRVLNPWLAQLGIDKAQVDRDNYHKMCLSCYNAGPVTALKAIQYAHVAGNWRRWLDAIHYQRALLFSGGYDRYKTCSMGVPETDVANARQERVFYRFKTTRWRTEPDPDEWNIVSVRLSSLLRCWIETKFSNTPHYLNKFISYYHYYNSVSPLPVTAAVATLIDEYGSLNEFDTSEEDFTEYRETAIYNDYGDHEQYDETGNKNMGNYQYLTQTDLEIDVANEEQYNHLFEVIDEEAYFTEFEENPSTNEFVFDSNEGITEYINVSAVKGSKLLTGIFIPAGFNQWKTLDIILYFHGMYSNGSKANGIELYWQDYSNIRDAFYAGKKNAILIAPTLGQNPQKSDLLFYQNNGLDTFLDACIKELRDKNYVLPDSFIHQVILAGHSAGGKPLSAVLRNTNTYLANVIECWGFDCFYNYSWAAALAKNPDIPFYHFWSYSHGSMSGPGARANSLLKNYSSLKNIAPAKGITHPKVIEYAWNNTINASTHTWFNAIGPISIDSEEEGNVDEAVLFENDQPGISTDFEKVRFTLSREVAKKAKESPYAFARRVLKIIPVDANPGVSYDPDIWFNNFTNTSFLGRRINTPIHISMAQLLEQVENNFLDLHPEVSRQSKYEVGTLVGLTTDKDDPIRGSRTKPTSALRSFHLFGLALDINYRGNVYIENTKAFNKYMSNIGVLVTGAIPDLINWSLTNGNNTMSVDEYLQLHKQLDVLNTIFKTYCSFINDNSLLEQKLSMSTSSFWHTKTTAEVHHSIKRDLSDLSKVWERNTIELAQNGFFNFSTDFVKVMVENGFDWGARYGDLMHFDMRRTSIGKPVEVARYK
ncbi:MAG: hypothetical protein JWP37_3219 [Mucilaginibacter sp.]|nr:hypothetical protein [Mucilaginibacter sp.]